MKKESGVVKDQRQDINSKAEDDELNKVYDEIGGKTPRRFIPVPKVRRNERKGMER